MQVDRRDFLRISAQASVLLGTPISAATTGVTLSAQQGVVTAKAKTYTWQWSAEDDQWSLHDKHGRIMTSGPLQPVVLLQPVGEKQRHCLAAKPARNQIEGNRLTVVYESPDRSAILTLSLVFADESLQMSPVAFETKGGDDVVSLHYFAAANGNEISPRLQNDYLIMPGISESSAISSIVPALLGLQLTSWLGHGGRPSPGLHQQWALPAHFFCGVRRTGGNNAQGAMRENLSDAYCCGLASLPAGDLFLETRSGMHSPIVDVRSDLWGHARGPGRMELGATWYWAVGPTYRAAIRNYYLGLVDAGIISKKKNSPAKNAVVAAPQFNTWGAQVVARKRSPTFDEPFLLSVRDGIRAAGMKPGMIVLDDKWEEEYGLLEHSSRRFPNFFKTLDGFRADGMRVGMWAAFMRCQNPASLGLTTEHMLRQPDGKPVRIGTGPGGYYLFDFSQTEVQRILSEKAKAYVRRYRPDLVKFDFGYELPAISAAAPKNMQWAGERLFQKGLDVVVKSMKEEKPDLVVMYYCLSPLFTEYFDMHSPDDLYICVGDYDMEANRRFYFSSLLGEGGITAYGSGGYDWATVREIWFDSAAIGTLGSLNSFTPDETDAKPTPEIIAKFNGLTHVLRKTNVFSIESADRDPLSALRGAHMSCWVRTENGRPVVIALRPAGPNGGNGLGSYQDDVRANVAVVVASKTAEAISTSARLAIVPYGAGEVAIRRAPSGAQTAIVTEHLFQASPRTTRIPIANGLLAVSLRERLPDGSIVEWIEVSCA